jgi:sterol desaturase/sphingolipid hydroxylase (fatty acid hydroxylase superfamily)
MHKLHHAATEFNIITGIRFSIAERLFYEVAVIFILSVVLGLPSPHTALTFMFIYRTVDLLQHSDLPWDYGWLGYVIASPRFHRMHHSSEAEDFDANYGNLFTFWDYLFGTVARRYRGSPEAADTCKLGLADPEETRRINSAWYYAPLQATGVDYLVSWLKPKRTPDTQPGVASDEAKAASLTASKY